MLTEKTIVIWPQEALIPSVGNREIKIYVYPEDPLMKICVVSYGLNMEEAKRNVKELVKLAPDITGTGIMAMYLTGVVANHDPKEYTFDEIRELMEQNKIYLRVGDAVYGMFE